MKGFRHRRRRQAAREASIIALALEGEEAGEEYKYFAYLKELLHRQRYEVHLLPTRLGKSSPSHVLDRVIELEQEQALEHGVDRVWLVFDRDTSDQVGSVTNEATRRNYGIAASNPCFELWLLLHHEDVDPSAFGLDEPEARNKSQRLKVRIGEIRASGHLHPKDISIGLIDAARARARALLPEQSDNHRFPPCPGTFVYKIIDDLEELQLLPHRAPRPPGHEQLTTNSP